MILRFPIFIFCILSLVACSSSGGRAPVSDITSGESTRTAADSTYKSKRKTNKNLGNQKSYRVKKGDTLYSIGWNTGIDVDSLVQHNNLKAPYLIKVGQVLHLTANKQSQTKKVNNKSDLASQTAYKSGNSSCTGQNCNKNKQLEVAQEKTKAYSAKKPKEKVRSSTNKNKINKKVSGWSWPVKGKLTKRFSASQSTMQGISLVSERGSLIHTAAPGVVVYAGNGLRGYGNLIIVKHNNDYLSAYAHNEKLLVAENEQVNIGQKIAVMGDSGSDHVHLHFEIRYRGKSVDPLRYLPKR